MIKDEEKSVKSKVTGLKEVLKNGYIFRVMSKIGSQPSFKRLGDMINQMPLSFD